jgi:hypothetical protein
MIHFLVDMIFGVPLLLLPEVILPFFNLPVDETFTARLVGAALIAIGGMSAGMNRGGVKEYRLMLRLKLIWSFCAIVGSALAYKSGTPVEASGTVFVIFLIFFFIWFRYSRKIR